MLWLAFHFRNAFGLKPSPPPEISFSDFHSLECLANEICLYPSKNGEIIVDLKIYPLISALQTCKWRSANIFEANLKFMTFHQSLAI